MVVIKKCSGQGPFFASATCGGGRALAAGVEYCTRLSVRQKTRAVHNVCMHLIHTYTSCYHGGVLDEVVVVFISVRESNPVESIECGSSAKNNQQTVVVCRTYLSGFLGDSSNSLSFPRSCRTVLNSLAYVGRHYLISSSRREGNPMGVSCEVDPLFYMYSNENHASICLVSRDVAFLLFSLPSLCPPWLLFQCCIFVVSGWGGWGQEYYKKESKLLHLSI